MRNAVALVSLAAIGLAILWQSRAHQQLLAEIASLSQQVDRERRAAAGMGGNRETDLLQASEAAVLRSRTKAGVPASASLLSPVTGSVFNPRVFFSSDMKPRVAWKNLGIATPEAAFETWQWALDRADAAAFACTMQLSPAAKSRVDRFFQGLSSADQAKYRSPEALLAMGSLASATAEVGIQVLGVSPDGADAATVHAEWQYDSGMIRDNDVVFVHTADGWRRPVSDAAVASELQWLSRRPTPEK